eukprot:TRINITY_DN60927_c0_g1_i1.p2 TRINITY_DN60927_c0_g1~~TRINITY_DN60927_c0_g1_i1.p2  ORF type:complete len:229 (+),score=87.62 TRINITY_DN60927_c0_g1_i1:85-687(+)
MSAGLRERGNAAFTSRNFAEANELFSEAIAQDPKNHLLYSNRSAARLELGDAEGALSDARQCCQLDAEFAKGWSRQGAALYRLGDFDQATACYRRAMRLNPDSEPVKAALAMAERAAEGAGAQDPFARHFDETCWARLVASKQTQPYMRQPDFVAAVREIQADPKALSKHLGDVRVRAALKVLAGVDLGAVERRARAPCP